MCTKLWAILLFVQIISVNAQQVCKYPPNIPYQVYPYSQNDLQNYYRALNNMNLQRNIVYYPQRPINFQYARYPAINSQQSIQNVPQQNSQRDYFANIPTEIIDLTVSTSRPQQSNYFKIPTEVIDLTRTPIKRPQINPLQLGGVNQEETIQNKYPPANTKNIQFNIPRKIVRNFLVQSKPIEAKITRTFGDGKPKVYVLYNNIDSDDKDNDKQTTTTTTEVPETTTIEVETTTVDENPQPISRWFF